jgi:hypothetical protein
MFAETLAAARQIWSRMLMSHREVRAIRRTSTVHENAFSPAMNRPEICCLSML